VIKLEKINYRFYKDYLKTRAIDNISLLVSKTNNSYLIGPKVNLYFDEYSFYKRVISTSIYNQKIYRRAFKRKINKMIKKYYKLINDNEVIEIFNDGSTFYHKIISLPRGKYEK